MEHKRPALLLTAALVLAGVVGLRQVSGRSFDRVVAMAGDPVAIAVDDTTSRAFVVNGADSSVGVIDTDSGNVLRTVPVGHGALSIAVDERANRVFVPNTGDDNVSILDASLGFLVGSTALGFSPRLIAVDRQIARVYLVSTDGFFAVLDGRTGRLLRKLSLQRAPLALAVDSRLGRVYVANADGSVEARDASGGRLIFDVSASGYPCAIAVDEQTGRVFVADPLNAEVTMLSARTGAVLLRTHMASIPDALVVMSNLGKVFVESNPTAASICGPGCVTVLDARTGLVAAEAPLDQSPEAMIGDDHSDTLLIDVGSAVLAMSASNPAHIRSFPVLGARVTAESMAVDWKTGHLFVVNADNSNSIDATSGLDALSRWIPWLHSRSRAPFGSLNEFAIGA